jgi:hypothetical protein
VPAGDPAAVARTQSAARNEGANATKRAANNTDRGFATVLVRVLLSVPGSLCLDLIVLGLRHLVIEG